MSRSFNQATIYGNVTRDPELRTIPSGQSVVSLGVATNRRWKGPDGEFKEQAEFHNVVVWGKQAENIAQYVKKGDKVLVVGRLQTRSWDDTNGVKHQRTEVVASDVVFGSSRGGGAPVEAAEPTPAATPVPEAAEEEINIEDIPF